MKKLSAFAVLATVFVASRPGLAQELRQPSSVQRVTFSSDVARPIRVAQSEASDVAVVSEFTPEPVTDDVVVAPAMPADAPVAAPVQSPTAALPTHIDSRITSVQHCTDPGCSTCGSGCGLGCSSLGSGLGCSSLGCGSGCSGLGCGGCGGGKGLFDGWGLGGWLSWGSTLNSHGRHTSDGNAPVAFNNYADGFVLDQAWLYAAKEADNGGQGVAMGGRVDFLFGADGPDTQAFGDGSWDARWDTGGEYGFAMPQLYAEVAVNKLKTKVGRFFTIIGYEVVQATGNFFYSHAYTMNYNEPFTHTGFLSQYDASDDITIYGGWTAGWDSGFANTNGGSTFLGGVGLQLTDNINLVYGTTFGDRGAVLGTDTPTYMHSIVANIGLSDNLQYLFWSDFQTTDFGAGYEQAYSVVQYLVNTINDCWALGTRFEYFRDDSGNYIGNGPGNYWDWTVGLNYSGFGNFVTRPELRYDWFDGAGLPFDNNTKASQLTLGLNTYVTF
ncbi:MAG: porin [Pirellulaceae bacterium]